MKAISVSFIAVMLCVAAAFGQTVPFESTQGLIFVEAQVNGQRVSLIIDTGASSSLISYRVAGLGIQELKDLEALENADRASARAREVDLAKANARDHVPAVLALAVTAGFFITLWWIFVHGVNKEVHDLAMAMVGTLGTAWMGVVMYYFGSSKGSDDKTRLLGDIAKS